MVGIGSEISLPGSLAVLRERVRESLGAAIMVSEMLGTITFLELDSVSVGTESYEYMHVDVQCTVVVLPCRVRRKRGTAAAESGKLSAVN